jgi:hypothetical protein
MSFVSMFPCTKLTRLLEAERDSGGPAWKVPGHLSQATQADDQAAKARTSMCECMLSQALGKSEMADVRFSVRGAWAASGHRSAFSGRSPVFARMFENETEEKATGVVNMDDVTTDGLGMFLQFIYLGEAKFYYNSTLIHLCIAETLR